MKTLFKTRAAAAATREKARCPRQIPVSRVVSDSLSLPSYKDYPAHRPFTDTAVHHRPQARTHRSPSPSRAFPESNSAVILSALRNLQEKIRTLEEEKEQAELSLLVMGRDVPHSVQQRETVTPRHLLEPAGVQQERQPNCNQVLIDHLAAAESRCEKLERQLDHMRKMLQSARTERSSLLQQQVFTQRSKSAHQLSDSVSGAQLKKLDRLEQEYRKLTRTQEHAQVKIGKLEEKLQEEQHQRKLLQARSKQLQTGLETNRILLQSVSPQVSFRQSTDKKTRERRSSPQQRHYRLNLRDVPFVIGTSVSSSHSVHANVQSVLSLLKRHQPKLCNSCVLSGNADRSGVGNRADSDNSNSSSSSSPSSSSSSCSLSSSSCVCGKELLELLQTLQEELRLMSLAQRELTRQVENSVSLEETRGLHREQERLLLKMERKGEQISLVRKHKAQVKKLRKTHSQRRRGKEVRASTAVSTRGRCAATVKVKPGERSKSNLRLLRDMKALQTSLQT